MVETPKLKLKIGADPEIFLLRNGHYMSAHGLKCGTKDKPLATKHGSVQVDGVALEVNVTPAETSAEFVTNLRNVMNDLKEIVHREERTAKLHVAPSIFFGKDRLAELPLEARALGCTPDFDAYTKRLNPRPDENCEWRTAAGHIHVGWTEDQHPRDVSHFNMCARLAIQLDYYLGLPSLLWDYDATRRKLYGGPGSFRPKPYGMEYRVLSSAWIKSSALTSYVFEQTKKGFEALLDGTDMFDNYGLLAKNMIEKNDTSWRKQYNLLASEIL